jgi:glycerol-3-phosphate acyltransferase PlsY
VATAGGVILALYWPVGLMGLATWLVVAALSRISSLSALVAAAATPIYFLFFLGDRLYALTALVLAIFIFVSHRANIARLLRGEEPRIGRKAQAA